MHLARRHAWDLPPAEAMALQERLRVEVVADRPLDLGAVRHLAGVDVSVKGGRTRAAVVVQSFPDLATIEIATAERAVSYLYVPGLLAFREGPVLEEAFERLQAVPDAFLFDGQGIAHPRRLGIAAHMGLWLERPSVGCGKTRLVGRHATPGEVRGERETLTDRGEVIGTVLRTRARVAPLYVSPGHLIDLDSAAALVLAACSRYRLPEPIRAAHKAAGHFTP